MVRISAGTPLTKIAGLAQVLEAEQVEDVLVPDPFRGSRVDHTDT